uniref:Uncharacterized protein n=1 Tax=Bacteriophage sp. TaxID=38018 RepID=A0A8D9UHK8_9VIRU|nr:MAG TPA: hypothetical protein [Bacteriophage sp.]
MPFYIGQKVRCQYLQQNLTITFYSVIVLDIYLY